MTLNSVGLNFFCFILFHNSTEPRARVERAQTPQHKSEGARRGHALFGRGFRADVVVWRAGLVREPPRIHVQVFVGGASGRSSRGLPVKKSSAVSDGLARCLFIYICCLFPVRRRDVQPRVIIKHSCVGKNTSSDG